MKRYAWIVAVMLAGVLPAVALINLRFTPADLVRGAEHVFAVKVSQAKDKVFTVEIVEAIRGQAPAEPKLGLHVDPAGGLSADDFGAMLPAKGLMVLAATENLNLDEDPAGALLIGSLWFALFKKDGKFVVDTDKQELGQVWAGSADNLIAGARYVQSDPAAAFPVRSDLTWSKDQSLGKLTGKVHGCLVTDDGVIVLSEGGDCVFKGTNRLALPTASKRAALAVMAPNTKPELVSWNGKSLVVAGRTLVAELAGCLSLDALETGRLVVGTPTGPVLVDAEGKTEALPGAKDLGAGGLCVVADFDRDGRTDVVQLFAKGLVLYSGEGGGKFRAPASAALALPANPASAACGDFDTDGWPDMVVGGDGAMVYVSRDGEQKWQNQSHVTGELAYHGGANQPKVIGTALSDINGDGRQGVALFYADRKPMMFFNRGFGCFGWARELDPANKTGTDTLPGEAAAPEEPLKGWLALEQGQTAGAMLDINGDNVPDLFAVTAGAHEAWVLYGENRASPQQRLLSVSAAAPVMVTVRDRNRVTGMYQVRPGMPATVARPQAGPVTLEWVDAAGKAASQKVIVVKPFTRVTLP